jgi:hypothetical protein
MTEPSRVGYPQPYPGLKEDVPRYLHSELRRLGNAINDHADWLETVSGGGGGPHTHDAADVISGTFDAARIPNLDASKLTSGVLNSARIPALSYAPVVHTHDASDITAGTLDAARIPALSYAATTHTHDASAIVSGTIDAARLPATTAPALTLIERWTAAGGETSKTFSSLGTYNDLLLKFNGRTTATLTGNSVAVYLNGDSTTTNYQIEQWNRYGSGVSNNVPTISVGDSGGSGLRAAPWVCTGTLEIFDYRGATYNKVMRSETLNRYNNNDMIRSIASIAWLSSAAVTSLVVTATGTSFVAGSTLTLYGRG